MPILRLEAAPSIQRMPFTHAVIREVFAEETLWTLNELFNATEGWQQRNEGFYECALKDVTQDVSLAVRRAVRGLLRNSFGHPLIEDVTVTAQQMTPGQSIGVHSDQPLLGFEFARLVVQFNRDWTVSNGGQLRLHTALDAPSTGETHPHWNSGFAFILHPESFHSVTEVQNTRRSLVFNCWHPGNTPELARAVQGLMEGLSFHSLPDALQPLAEQFETHLAEDVTYRASVAAWVLMNWGFHTNVIVAGYQAVAAGVETDNIAEIEHIAVAWASWLAQLHQGVFCPTTWFRLTAQADIGKGDPRLQSIGERLFPHGSY